MSGTEELSLTSLFTSSGLKKTMKIMDGLLAIRDCFNALLPPDAGKLVSGCFTTDDIMTAFGWLGLVLAPLMLLGSIVEFFVSEISSFIDLLKNTPSYAVV